MKTAFATIRGFEVVRPLKTGQGFLLGFLPGIAGEVSLVHQASALSGRPRANRPALLALDQSPQQSRP